MGRIGDHALIEGPEVLARTTAAGDDDGIDGLRPVHALDGAQRPCDLGGGAVALHPHIDEHELDSGAAVRRGLEHILQAGPP